MIKYSRVSSIKLSNPASLPVIERTEEGAAMGFVPGWEMLVDPDYIDADQSRVRDRAKANSFAASLGTSGNPLITKGQFPNGESGFINPAAGGPGLGMTLPVRVNPESWSYFIIVRPETNPGARIWANLSSIAGEGVIAPYVAISTDMQRLSLFEHLSGSTGVNLRLQGEIGLDVDSNPALLMVTSSISNGLSMYKNGVRIARNSDDKRPLNSGFNPFETSAFLGFRGIAGMFGVLNTDLGAQSNSGYRRAIERFLMSKYGIPQVSQ